MAERSKKLSEQEARELGDELRYDINTSFGNRNEDAALLLYERLTGTEVWRGVSNVGTIPGCK